MFIHVMLLRICDQSGFEHLRYHGGPEVVCEGCGEQSILPCVTYSGRGLNSQPNPSPVCPICCREYDDVNYIMVRFIEAALAL